MSLVFSGTNGVTFPDSSLQAAAASPYVLKNRIINGAMVIDQRNAGASVSANGAFPVDRFKVVNSTDGTYTGQQTAITLAGFNYSTKVTIGTADTSLTSYQNLRIEQDIEGFNVADLNWGTANAKTVTLSFWVYSSLTGTFGGAILNSAQDRSYPFTYTISAANTWEYKTVTIAGDTTGTWLTTNGIGIMLSISLGASSSACGTAGSWAATTYYGATGQTQVIGTTGATFYITGVQLEQNTSATPFERRLYGQELANCQRYFQSSFPIGTAPAQNVAGNQLLFSAPLNNIVGGTSFLVQMRTSPTITTYNPYAANASFRIPSTPTDIAVTAGGISGYSIGYFSATITGPSALHGNWSATAEL